VAHLVGELGAVSAGQYVGVHRAVLAVLQVAQHKSTILRVKTNHISQLPHGSFACNEMRAASTEPASKS